MNFNTLDSAAGPNGEITNQFASQGVIFSQVAAGNGFGGASPTSLFLNGDTGLPTAGGFPGPNYLSVAQLSGFALPLDPDVITLSFLAPVTAASFSYVDPANATFISIQAFLAGNPVAGESYASQAAPTGGNSDFYGFTNSLFDSIQITNTGSPGFITRGSIGTISFDLATTGAPELDPISSGVPFAFASVLLLALQSRRRNS